MSKLNYSNRLAHIQLNMFKIHNTVMYLQIYLKHEKFKSIWSHVLIQTHF